MKRIAAMAALAWISGNALAADENPFYAMRALGREEARQTAVTLAGNAESQDLIEQNRDLGRAEARWIPEDFGAVDRQAGRAIGTGDGKGQVCAAARLKRDC